MLCRFSDFINDVTFICVPQFRLLAPPCIVLLRCILVDGTCNPNSFVSSSAQYFIVWLNHNSSGLPGRTLRWFPFFSLLQPALGHVLVPVSAHLDRRGSLKAGASSVAGSRAGWLSDLLCQGAPCPGSWFLGSCHHMSGHYSLSVGQMAEIVSLSLFAGGWSSDCAHRFVVCCWAGFLMFTQLSITGLPFMVCSFCFLIKKSFPT